MIQTYLKQHITQHVAEKAERERLTQERMARKKKPVTKRACNKERKKKFKLLIDSGKQVKDACLSVGIAKKTGYDWISEA